MPAELTTALVVLALIDSTSFGTLLLPIWLMLAPDKPQPRRISLFIATVAVSYFVLGVGLLLGLFTFSDGIAEVLENRLVRMTQLFTGIGLMVLGAIMEPWTKSGKVKKQAARQAKNRRHPSRLIKIRYQITSGASSPTTVIGIALGATAIEAATMLPYLVAIGLLGASGLSLHQGGVVLVAYSMVMISPALILLLLRMLLHERISPALQRIEGWMSRHSGEATAWIAFLSGLFLTSNAAQALSGR